MPDWIRDPHSRQALIGYTAAVLLACTTGFASLTFFIMKRVDSRTEALYLSHTSRGGYDERLTRLEVIVETHQKDGHPKRSESKTGQSVFVDASD